MNKPLKALRKKGLTVEPIDWEDDSGRIAFDEWEKRQSMKKALKEKTEPSKEEVKYIMDTYTTEDLNKAYEQGKLDKEKEIDWNIGRILYETGGDYSIVGKEISHIVKKGIGK